MLGFLLAGFVVGVVLLALFVKHRFPDEAEFSRRIAKSHAPGSSDSPNDPNATVPILRLLRSDFNDSYIGKVDLTQHLGDLEIAAELGDIRIDTSLLINGNLRVAAGTCLTVLGELNCGEAIYVAGSLHVESSIESGLAIHCGDTLSAGASIFCSGTIGCGSRIQAGGSIVAGENIRAGVEISARGAIHAAGTIEAPVVTAGRRDDPRTITCSRLLRGRVNRGELVETGDARS